MTKEEFEKAHRLTETTDREEKIRLAMELFGMSRERAEEVTDEAMKMYQKGGLLTQEEILEILSGEVPPEEMIRRGEKEGGENV